MKRATCPGCYQSHFDGSWWCDNCDQWPCICTEEGAWTPCNAERGSLRCTLRCLHLDRLNKDHPHLSADGVAWNDTESWRICGARWGGGSLPCALELGHNGSHREIGIVAGQWANHGPRVRRPQSAGDTR